MPTHIQWTDETWNPTTGCDRCSPGCDHCYIERTFPFRIEGRKFDENGKMGVRLHPDRLDKPLHWRKPRRVFVNSLSDLFHADVPDEFIVKVFDTMGNAPQHVFQVLTKRPQRMASFMVSYYAGEFSDRGTAERMQMRPFRNVWLGTSIESDKYTFRANHLRRTPAAIRFVSCEPLLGPLPSLDLTLIDWVIVGGESGPHARPMSPDWARDLRGRCRDLDIPFFFKQVGGRTPQAGGRELDGRTWDEMPSPGPLQYALTPFAGRKTEETAPL